MYVDSATYKIKGKVFTRHLLPYGYRKDGKVHHKTHGSLNDCTEEEITAIKLALKYKNNLTLLGDIFNLKIKQVQSLEHFIC